MFHSWLLECVFSGTFISWVQPPPLPSRPVPDVDNISGVAALNNFLFFPFLLSDGLWGCFGIPPPGGANVEGTDYWTLPCYKKIQKQKRRKLQYVVKVWKGKLGTQNIAAMSHMPTFLSSSLMNCNHYTVKDAAALRRRATATREKNKAAEDETNGDISVTTKCAVCSFEMDREILLIDHLYIFLFYSASLRCFSRCQKTSCGSCSMSSPSPPQASVFENTQNTHDTKRSLRVAMFSWTFLFLFYQCKTTISSLEAPAVQEKKRWIVFSYPSVSTLHDRSVCDTLACVLVHPVK